jgi:hypothetical protein
MKYNLVVIPKTTLLIYALSYVLKYGKNENYKFLVIDLKTFSYLAPEEIPAINEISELMLSLNTTIVTFEEAKKTRYEKLMILPGYLFFASTESFLRNFEYSTLGMFADGLRNDNFYLAHQLSREKGVIEIYFGDLNILNPEGTSSPFAPSVTYEFVELNFIKEIWSKILEDFNLMISCW